MTATPLATVTNLTTQDLYCNAASALVPASSSIYITNAQAALVTTATGVFSVSYGAPVISSVAPTSGTDAGSTAVTLTGLAFTGATAVNFGGAAATSVVVVSDTEITCVSPAGPDETVAVTVTTALGGTSEVSVFTYSGGDAGFPSIEGLSPTTSAHATPTPVTITGTNFTGATAVHFGAGAATAVVVVSDTEITCSITAASSGVVSVTVTNPIGTGGDAEYTFS